MVSPELLRRYPFFGGLTNDHLNGIAMLAEEVIYESDETIFETGQPAAALFFLLEGNVELHYVVVDEINPQLRKDLFVTEINPGEPFGISAVIEPYVYTGTMRTAGVSRVLRFDANGLRALCTVDPKIDAALMRQIASAAMSRLEDTRTQLVAARVA
jgi:CRP-like cAMP-binding protein